MVLIARTCDTVSYEILKNIALYPFFLPTGKVWTYRCSTSVLAPSQSNNSLASRSGLVLMSVSVITIYFACTLSCLVRLSGNLLVNAAASVRFVSFIRPISVTW